MDFWIDSLKVRDSLLILDSPKWILRAVALSMTRNIRFVESHESVAFKNYAFCNSSILREIRGLCRKIRAR